MLIRRWPARWRRPSSGFSWPISKLLAQALKGLGWKKVLVIDGAEVNANFALAARNIDGIDVLPSVGANVYDILRRQKLVLTKAGVEALEARLK